MKNIQLYEDFRLNESSKSFFRKRGMPERYDDRLRSYGLSSNPSVLGKVENFFQKIENRLDKMAYIGQGLQQARRQERGGRFNTGFEILFGAASIVPNLLKRVFGPTEFGLIKSDNDVNLETMRHINDDFVKKDLPNIKSEKDLEDNISDLYKKGGVRKGESPVLDEIAKNRANIFFGKQINPNVPIQ